MTGKREKYISPKITTKKVKYNLFSSHVWWEDAFKIIGKVYAQSTDGGYGGDSGYVDSVGDGTYSI